MIKTTVEVDQTDINFGTSPVTERKGVLLLLRFGKLHKQVLQSLP